MKAKRVEGLDPRETLRANAALIVRTRLEELRGFEEHALDQSATVVQHDMRIAAKRLRYVLEITESCFGAEAREARKAAKRLQGVLGDLHDCDVMLARTEGIESLTQLLRTRREDLFRRFCDLCGAEAQAGTWTALERSL
jgi:CHAD domain-containing protein